ncbi:MAG: hypothetical protein ACI8TV_000788, partial [Porticoccaceae bacterium]
SPVDQRCGAGKVATGAYIWVNSNYGDIDDIKLICTDFNAAMDLESHVTVLDYFADGPSPSAVEHHFTCPQYSVLSQLDTSFDPQVVDSLGFSCSPLNADGSTGTPVSQSNLGYASEYGTIRGSAQSLPCSGRMITGIRGRAGQRVDQIGHHCSDMQQMLAGTAETGLGDPFGSTTGGSPVDQRCGAGKVATGAYVWVNSNYGDIGDIKLICTDFNAAMNPEPNDTVLDYFADGPSPSAVEHLFSCPQNSVLSQLDASFDPQVVDSLGFSCSPLNADGSTGIPVSQSNLGYASEYGTVRGSTQSLPCSGRMITGIRGRAGQRVDQIGHHCSDMQQMLAGTAETGIGDPYGSTTGGSPVDQRCGAGKVATGASVWVNSNYGDIGDIKLICTDFNATMDQDGDGFVNNVDNCPSVSNPLQMDSDGNSVGDDCDAGLAPYLTIEPNTLNTSTPIGGYAPFEMPVATCTDFEDGNLPVDVSDPIDLTQAGTYKPVYSCQDQDGNTVSSAIDDFIVEVFEKSPVDPIITIGTSPYQPDENGLITILQGTTFSEPLFECEIDPRGTKQMLTQGFEDVDTFEPNLYSIDFSCSDGLGGFASYSLAVSVVEDSTLSGYFIVEDDETTLGSSIYHSQARHLLSFACPDGTIMSAIGIRANILVSGNETGVDAVQFACAELLADGSTGTPVYQQDLGLGHPEFFEDSNYYDDEVIQIECPSRLITGLRLRGDSKLNQLGHFCSDIDEVFAHTYNDAYGALAGNQLDGEIKQSRCPAEYAATGAKINGYLGGNITDIQLICNRIDLNDAENDGVRPEITLDPVDIRIPRDSAFAQPLVTCVDNVDGNRPVTVEGAVEPSSVGVYTPVYTCQDESGNSVSSEEGDIRVEVYSDEFAVVDNDETTLGSSIYHSQARHLLSFACPDSTLMTEIGIRANIIVSGNETGVDAVQFACAELLADGSTGTPVYQQDLGLGHPEFFEDSNYYDDEVIQIECPSRLITGLRLRGDSKLNQLGHFCSDIKEVFADTHNNAYGALAGNQLDGEIKYSRCPAEYAATGAKINGYLGGNITDIQLICNRIAFPEDDVPPDLTVDPEIIDMAIPHTGEFIEPTLSCVDDVDDNPEITVSGAVNLNEVGIYTPVYTCEDYAWNTDSSTEGDIRVEVYEDTIDTDFDGILDAYEPMCADDPDEFCYLREQQHYKMMALIQEHLGGLTDAQITQVDDEAKDLFVTDNPLKDYNCTEWAARLEAQFGAEQLALEEVCSDFDGDGIPDTDDDYPTDPSWSCDYPNNLGLVIDNSQCEVNYSKIEEIYLSIYGSATNPELFGPMISHYLDFASGGATCADVLMDEVDKVGVDIELHYQVCASLQSKRTAEIVSAICDANDPASIYSPQECRFGKPLIQFISASSFEIQTQTDWWDFLPLGTDVEYLLKNDFRCYVDSKFSDPEFGPEMSATSEHLCFTSEDQPVHETYFPAHVPLYSMGQGGTPLIEHILGNHEFSYANWSFNRKEYECSENPQDFWCPGHNNSDLEPGILPILISHDFDFENPVDDAVDMRTQSCWRENKTILGYKSKNPGTCDLYEFKVTDHKPGGDDWYVDNKVQLKSEFYSQPVGFSDGGFMLNRCRVKAEYDHWLKYLSGETNQPPADLSSYSYEYDCSIDGKRLEELITTQLNADDVERLEMFQAMAELALMAVSNASGFAGAQYATKAGKLAKAVRFATTAWEAAEMTMEVSSIAAQVYVLAYEDIPRCRALKGVEKEACFATTLGSTLMNVVSIAAEDQFDKRRAKFLEDVSRKVPNDDEDLSGDTVADQIYTENDFTVQIEATRQLIQTNLGQPSSHHQFWIDAGVDLPGLSKDLIDAGESSLAENLNSAFHDLPPKIREIGNFRQRAAEIFNDAQGLGAVEKSENLLNLVNSFSEMSSVIGDIDLRIIDSMTQGEFLLFSDLLRNADVASWTEQTKREQLDLFLIQITSIDPHLEFWKDNNVDLDSALRSLNDQGLDEVANNLNQALIDASSNTNLNQIQVYIDGVRARTHSTRDGVFDPEGLTRYIKNWDSYTTALIGEPNPLDPADVFWDSDVIEHLEYRANNFDDTNETQWIDQYKENYSWEPASQEEIRSRIENDNPSVCPI